MNTNTSEAKKLKAIIDKEELNWRSFLIQDAIDAQWNHPGTPMYYIIDRAGVIRHKWFGSPGGKAIDAALDKLIEEAEGKSVTPAQQYEELLKEQQNVPYDLAKATTEDDRKKVVARLQSLPLRFLELAEKHPQDAVALDALIQMVLIVNSTAFPAGGKDSPGSRALAILERDHVRSERLGRVCQQLAFGFHQSHEMFLRAVLELNSHKEVQGLACLSLAQFLQNRSQRIDSLRDLGRADEIERYHRVFGKDFVEALQRQDRAKVAAEIESLFARAAENYFDVKIPVVFLGSGGLVGEKAEQALFQIRHLAIGRPAPAITGEDQDGKRFQLSDYRGKVVLLYFWDQN